MESNKRNSDLSKEEYIKLLVGLFLLSTLIAVGGSVVKSRLGYDYVFRSWLDVIHSVAWVLMIGLIFIIPFTYLNAWLGGIVILFVLIGAYIWACIGYDEEIRQGEYIVTETQQLGEKVIRYYEDINIFIMKRSHEEDIR